MDALEGKVRVFGFQSRLRAAFQHAAESANHSDNSDADPSAALAAVAALERELLPLSDMYNDFARPAEMYDVCLEMLHFSRYDDPEGAVARELWERYLMKSANRASTRRRGHDAPRRAARRAYTHDSYACERALEDDPVPLGNLADEDFGLSLDFSEDDEDSLLRDACFDVLGAVPNVNENEEAAFQALLECVA